MSNENLTNDFRAGVALYGHPGKTEATGDDARPFVPAVDLSYAGVDNILAAIAEAGAEPHYNETDGETWLDVQLADLDADTATALSWRDNEGWRLREWDSNDTAGTTIREWSIVGDSLADVARKVASVLNPGPKPDYYITLADSLREIADRVETLAGIAKCQQVSLTFAADIMKGNHETSVPVVDTIAAAFGTTAAPKKFATSMWEHSASTERGDITISTHAYIPVPEDPETAALRAEIEQLRAKLAECRES